MPPRIQVQFYGVKILVSFVFSFSWSVTEFLQELKHRSLLSSALLVFLSHSTPKKRARWCSTQLYSSPLSSVPIGLCYLILQLPTLWKNSTGCNMPDCLRGTGVRGVAKEVEHWEKLIRKEKEEHNLNTLSVKWNKAGRHSQARTASVGRVGRDSENSTFPSIMMCVASVTASTALGDRWREGRPWTFSCGILSKFSAHTSPVTAWNWDKKILDFPVEQRRQRLLSRR